MEYNVEAIMFIIKKIIITIYIYGYVTGRAGLCLTPTCLTLVFGLLFFSSRLYIVTSCSLAEIFYFILYN